MVSGTSGHHPGHCCIAVRAWLRWWDEWLLGAPASYCRPRDLGHYEPCRRTPRVHIIESVESTPYVEAQEYGRHSIQRAAQGADIEDRVTLCERQYLRACNLRTPAEASDEAGHSGSRSSKARRFWKHGSLKCEEEEMAMETTPSPVRL